MTWLMENQDTNPALKLKDLMNKEKIIPTVGVFNPMVALLARQTGFKCCYLSGAALSASLGMPDLSLIELNEVAMMTKYIYRASNMPLIVDVDIGFGEILNVAKTAREMEESKAAAIQIEDQELPKRCGHLTGKRVIDKERMVQKIIAAKKSSKNLLIIARTDAKAVNGIEDAVERAKLYVKAGADIIFPEALETEEEFKRFAKELNIPLLANMTEFGKTPFISLNQFQDWGYKFVIYPVTALRIASKAIKDAFEHIKKYGTQKDITDKMQTRAKRII